MTTKEGGGGKPHIERGFEIKRLFAKTRRSLGSVPEEPMPVSHLCIAHGHRHQLVRAGVIRDDRKLHLFREQTQQVSVLALRSCETVPANVRRIVASVMRT